MITSMSPNGDSVFTIISWAYWVWATGEWPDTRHDNVKFVDSKLLGDSWRARRAGRARLVGQASWAGRAGFDV